jgi:hypothetical protein
MNKQELDKLTEKKLEDTFKNLKKTVAADIKNRDWIKCAKYWNIKKQESMDSVIQDEINYAIDKYVVRLLLNKFYHKIP